MFVDEPEFGTTVAAPSRLAPYVPLICLSLVHAIVDACALMIAPLWTTLEVKHAWTTAGLSLAFIVQSLPTSVSQVVFGWFRDRRPTPRMLWIGPLVAAGMLTLIGSASSTAILFALLIVGGFGVGAFHPEAAVTAGRLLPEQRTRALSIFMLGGSLGLGLGPAMSGLVVDRWGLGALGYLAIPLAVLVVVLCRAGGLGRGAGQFTLHKPISLSQAFEGRGVVAAYLLLICAVRLVPNMAMDKVLAYELASRGFGTAAIGLHQMLFLAAAGAGMTAMAFLFRPGWERPFMIACPLAGVPLLFILGMEQTPYWLFVAALVASGMLLWGTTPAMVSYAQQQFPNGAGVASALTMGLAWGVGGLIQTPITAHFAGTTNPQAAYVAFVPCLILAAVATMGLPGNSTRATAQRERLADGRSARR